MRATGFFIAVTVVILAGIIVLLRSRRLKEKYAALWVLVGVASIVLAIWPGLLAHVASFVGIQVASNLLFTLAILLLLAICLHLSLEVSSQEDKIRRLAEEAAIARQLMDSVLQTRDPEGSLPVSPHTRLVTAFQSGRSDRPCDSSEVLGPGHVGEEATA